MDLDAIEQRANAATEGPWASEAHHHRISGKPVLFEVHPVAELEGNGDGGVTTAADAEFIAHARTDVPALVARVRELEADLGAATRFEIGPVEVYARFGGWALCVDRAHLEKADTRDAALARARDIAKEDAK
jgi:hypothetical protein